MVLFGLRGSSAGSRPGSCWPGQSGGTGVYFPAGLAQWQRGKPYFPSPRCQFNLSHSGTLALCALSDRPVGVDIQMVRPSGRTV